MLSPGGTAEDGGENAGTIKSFEGGVLTITLAQGGEMSGTVDDITEIECHTAGDRSAHHPTKGRTRTRAPQTTVVKGQTTTTATMRMVTTSTITAAMTTTAVERTR